jgi:hypothetical protein
VHLPRQIPVSALPGTTLRWQELSRKLSRSLQPFSAFLQSGPPHARERIRRPVVTHPHNPKDNLG